MLYPHSKAYTHIIYSLALFIVLSTDFIIQNVCVLFGLKKNLHFSNRISYNVYVSCLVFQSTFSIYIEGIYINTPAHDQDH